MKKLTSILDDAAKHDLAPVLWRCIGRPLATITGAILLAIVIVHGESWAIRQAPLLHSDGAIAGSPIVGCIPEGGADGGALPVAILH
jgi:hypothetical protein